MPELHLTDPARAHEPDFIAQVKTALNLPDDAQLELQNVARGAAGGAALEYAVTVPIELRGDEFGAADGVSVDERVTATLNFDARGVLALADVSPIDERHLQSVKTNVRKLAAAEQIERVSPNESLGTSKTRAPRKPWYIATDADGRKRLRRALMA